VDLLRKKRPRKCHPDLEQLIDQAMASGMGSEQGLSIDINAINRCLLEEHRDEYLLAYAKDEALQRLGPKDFKRIEVTPVVRDGKLVDISITGPEELARKIATIKKNLELY
jgi:hypothetical protein